MAETILITGITGFVGSHMADFILAEKPNVRVVGTKRWHLSRLDNIEHLIGKIGMYDVDLTDPIGTRSMIEKVRPDRVFHCAAESFVSPSWDHPHRYMAVNYNGTVNLLDALRIVKPDVIFHIPGSGEEYGDIAEADIPIRPETAMKPVNPYAVSKIAQDLIGLVYQRSYGLKVIRTRAFNHEGPRRERVFGISWYAYQVARVELGLQEPVLKVGFLDDKRNFTHVRDMVEAYWISTEKCEPGELYLVGSDDDRSVFTFRDALERLIASSTVKGITYATEPGFVRPTQVPRLIADISKFHDLTGWRPKIPFDQILSDTLDYWRVYLKRCVERGLTKTPDAYGFF